jgi:hypothetical protein
MKTCQSSCFREFCSQKCNTPSAFRLAGYLTVRVESFRF